jgi:hypothetical protein
MSLQSSSPGIRCLATEEPGPCSSAVLWALNPPEFAGAELVEAIEAGVDEFDTDIALVLCATADTS